MHSNFRDQGKFTGVNGDKRDEKGTRSPQTLGNPGSGSKCSGVKRGQWICSCVTKCPSWLWQFVWPLSSCEQTYREGLTLTVPLGFISVFRSITTFLRLFPSPKWTGVVPTYSVGPERTPLWWRTGGHMVPNGGSSLRQWRRKWDKYISIWEYDLRSETIVKKKKIYPMIVTKPMSTWDKKDENRTLHKPEDPLEVSRRNNIRLY